MNSKLSTFEVIIPMASFGVSGFVTSRVSIAEAEQMLNQKLTPHPEIDHEALLSSLEMVGMRHYGGGLPVAEVRVGSAAEGAGLRVWDVIVKVDGVDMRKENASTILKELLKSKNGLSFTVLRASKSPSGPVEVLRKKKKSKLFGCFSFSSNVNKQTSGGFAPEKAPVHKTASRPYEATHGPPGPSSIPYNIPMTRPMAQAPAAPNLIPPPKNGDTSTENVADFSIVVDDKPSDKENQFGQMGYIFDDNGPVYQPGVIMAY